MPKTAVSCTGIGKRFTKYVFPSEMLQDRILRWRRHKRRWTHTALREVELAIEQGEWVGLSGPNGSGKTTLLRILAGLMPPDSGTVKINGKLSCFFELGVGFHPEKSAVENIYLHGLIHGLHPDVIRRKTDEIIERAGVRTHRDLPFKCYSQGMKMRLAFITTMRTESDIYFLDEIFAVGDEEFQKICREELRLLKENGKTVVLVLHELKELRNICDRIVFLENGEICKEETVLPPAPTTSA